MRQATGSPDKTQLGGRYCGSLLTAYNTELHKQVAECLMGKSDE